jgi:hypothetical protein
MTLKLRGFCVLTIGGALLLPAQQNSARQNGQLTQREAYSPAFYSGNPDKAGYGYGVQSLVVFPYSGPSYTVRLPFAIAAEAQTADGSVLYAPAFYTESAVKSNTPGAPERPGLFRFELNSMRMTEVPVTPNLGVFALTVSQREDKLIVSGRLREGRRQTCGLFEVSLPGGAVKSVFERPYCEYLGSWTYLSLSPDGERVLANRQGNLEMIDLGNHSVQSLGRYATATWSPDGSVIAVVDDHGAVLMDAKTLVRQKILRGDMTGSWSPDSRYLIGTTARGCHGYSFTLQAVDVASGERRMIDSSRCEVDRATITWVSIQRPQ